MSGNVDGCRMSGPLQAAMRVRTSRTLSTAPARVISPVRRETLPQASTATTAKRKSGRLTMQHSTGLALVLVPAG